MLRLHNALRHAAREIKKVLKEMVHNLRESGAAQGAQNFNAILDFKWLTFDHKFGTLIDIGANDGTYGAFLRRYFNIATTYAFEPLEMHHHNLRDLGFEVFPVALSDSDGETSFVINAQHSSSSILPMSDLMKSRFPELSETRTVTVPLARLDQCLGDREMKGEVLIKIDAQGVEDAIIRGGAKTFGAASCVLIEMSYVPLYEKQAVFNDVHVLLTMHGFQMTGIKNQICASADHRPLFSHCVYQRR